MPAPESRARALLDQQWEAIASAVKKGLEDESIPKIDSAIPVAPAPVTNWSTIEESYRLTVDALRQPPLNLLQTVGELARHGLWHAVLEQLIDASRMHTQPYDAELDTTGIVHGDGVRRLLLLDGDKSHAETLREKGRIDSFTDLIGMASGRYRPVQALYFRTIDGPYLELEDLALGWDPESDRAITVVVHGRFRMHRVEATARGTPRVVALVAPP